MDISHKQGAAQSPLPNVSISTLLNQIHQKPEQSPAAKSVDSPSNSGAPESPLRNFSVSTLLNQIPQKPEQSPAAKSVDSPSTSGATESPLRNFSVSTLLNQIPQKPEQSPAAKSVDSPSNSGAPESPLRNFSVSTLLNQIPQKPEQSPAAKSVDSPSHSGATESPLRNFSVSTLLNQSPAARSVDSPSNSGATESPLRNFSVSTLLNQIPQKPEQSSTSESAKAPASHSSPWPGLPKPSSSAAATPATAQHPDTTAAVEPGTTSRMARTTDTVAAKRAKVSHTTLQIMCTGPAAADVTLATATTADSLDGAGGASPGMALVPDNSPETAGTLPSAVPCSPSQAPSAPAGTPTCKAISAHPRSPAALLTSAIHQGRRRPPDATGGGVGREGSPELPELADIVQGAPQCSPGGRAVKRRPLLHVAATSANSPAEPDPPDAAVASQGSALQAMASLEDWKADVLLGLRGPARSTASPTASYEPDIDAPSGPGSPGPVSTTRGPLYKPSDVATKNPVCRSPTSPSRSAFRPVVHPTPTAPQPPPLTGLSPGAGARPPFAPALAQPSPPHETFAVPSPQPRSPGRTCVGGRKAAAALSQSHTQGLGSGLGLEPPPKRARGSTPSIFPPASYPAPVRVLPSTVVQLQDHAVALQAAADLVSSSSPALNSPNCLRTGPSSELIAPGPGCEPNRTSCGVVPGLAHVRAGLTWLQFAVLLQTYSQQEGTSVPHQDWYREMAHATFVQTAEACEGYAEAASAQGLRPKAYLCYTLMVFAYRGAWQTSFGATSTRHHCLQTHLAQVQTTPMEDGPARALSWADAAAYSAPMGHIIKVWEWAARAEFYREGLRPSPVNQNLLHVTFEDLEQYVNTMLPLVR